MGCDIHVYLEGNRDGKEWRNLDYYEKSCFDEDGFSVVPIYDGRNYGLFGILANVRNYYGNEPISEPKGLPEDCNEDIQKEYETWYGDAHSASYLTLKELKDYRDKHRTMKYRGMISPEQQKDLDEKGVTPDTWCQGTNMKGYEFRCWTEELVVLDPIIEAIEKRICDKWWIFYRTEEEKEEKIKDYLEKVRIVFWFDN